MTHRRLTIVYFVSFMFCIACAAQASLPVCENPGADPDGDGYGWENSESCRMTNVDDELSFNVIQPSSPSNLVSISWRASTGYNPFSTELLTYEIWKNGQLLATVAATEYLIEVSELESDIGCIRIRAVQGTQKSEHSLPVCFYVRH